MLDPFATESTTFDDPVAMLCACHDRVRHYADLLVRLVAHCREHGADAAVCQAAQAVLRYFEVAAPLHHADEDEDLFPALRARVPVEVQATMIRLGAEHDELEREWRRWRERLQQLLAGKVAQLPLSQAEAFAARYRAHAASEEGDVYPWAGRLLSSEELAALGARMAARRR